MADHVHVHVHRKSGPSGSKGRTHTHEHKSKTHSGSKPKHHSSSKSPPHSGSKTPTGSGSRSKTKTSSGSRTYTRSHTPTPPNDVESCRTSPTPIVVSAVLLWFIAVSSLVLIVVGIWLLAARNGWPAGLDLNNNLAWTRFISFGTACIIVGILLIPLIILSYFGARCPRNTRYNRLFRMLTVFVAAVIFICLFLMVITALMFATYGPKFIANIIDNGWIHLVEDDDHFIDACRIQSRYNCVGWGDNSCRDCDPTIERGPDQCTIPQRSICPRCQTRLRVEFNAEGGPPAGEGQQSAAIGDLGELRPISLRTEIPDQNPNPNGQNRNPNNQNRNPGGKGRGPVKQKQQSGATFVQGCKHPVLRRYREFFIPFVLFIIFLAVIVLFESWKTCIDGFKV